MVSSVNGNVVNIVKSRVLVFSDKTCIFSILYLLSLFNAFQDQGPENLEGLIIGTRYFFCYEIVFNCLSQFFQ